MKRDERDRLSFSKYCVGKGSGRKTMSENIEIKGNGSTNPGYSSTDPDEEKKVLNTCKNTLFNQLLGIWYTRSLKIRVRVSFLSLHNFEFRLMITVLFLIIERLY